MPVPLSVKASAVPNVKLFKSSTAPLITEVPKAVVPSGVLVASPAAPSLRVPALIVVRPAYVLLALKVNVPEPDLVSPPVPAITLDIDRKSEAISVRITNSILLLLIPVPPEMVAAPEPDFRIPGVVRVTVWLSAMVKLYAPFIFRVRMEIVSWALMAPSRRICLLASALLILVPAVTMATVAPSVL